MQSKNNSHIFYTLNGEILVDFWIDETSDKGFSFGPSIKGSNIHLTVWEDKNKIRYHIRHKGITEPSDESPIGRQISTKLVGNEIQKMLKKRLKNFHGNKKCFVFTQDRWERIKTTLPKMKFDAEGNLYIPLELIFSQIDMDFSNKNLWQKVRIKSLLTHKPNFGFIKTKSGLREVVPISKSLMLSYPLSKTSELIDYLSKIMGVDDFFNYMDITGEKKKILSKNKSRIR
jgi:hypothetical protein